MKKKRLLAIFAATAIMAGTILAVGCSKSTEESEPDSTETFEGTVCAQSFETQNAAAQACVESEINGSEYGVQFSSYEKGEDLTAEQVTELNLSAKVNGTVEGVEKGKIYFTENSQASAVAASSGAGLYITVYMIKYTPTGTQTTKYTYLIPLPENGEPLSASYYADVMNPAKYLNCTLDCSTVSTSGAMGITANVTFNYTIQFDNNKAYVHATLTQPTDMTMSGYIYETHTVDMYMAENADTLQCAVRRDNSEYAVGDASDLFGAPVSTLHDLITLDLAEAQYSMFVKTNYGFALNSKFLEEVLSKSLENSGVGATFSGMSCKYYVADGRLSKVTSNINMSMRIEEGGMSFNVTASASANVNYTSFGTTSVSIPTDVQSLLGIGNAQ